MSIPITFNGVEYDVPEFRDTNYANELTQFFVAIPNGTLQPTGGTFTLLAEVDFGASYGVKSLYVKSRGSNPSTAGIFRMASAESIGWRNNANDGNLLLATNASDELLYDGDQVLTGTGPSAYVSSITGTANQVVASGSTGAVTLSLPQSIATSSALQFGSLALGASLDSSSLLSMSSTSKGFLPPRMTTVQRDAIGTPATGLMIYNTTTNQYNSYDGGAWVALAMSGGGTVDAGTQYQLGYYAANGTTISGLTLITAGKALASNGNGLPIAATTTETELNYLSGVTSAVQTQFTGKANLALGNLASVAINTTLVSDTDNTDDLGTSAIAWKDIFLKGALKSGGSTLATITELSYLSGVTSAIQTQLNLLAPLASPTFTGTVTIPTPFTLGATSVTATGTEMNYLVGVTSGIQTQLDAKAADSLVVHLAGSETITGAKTFSAALLAPNGSAANPAYSATNDPDCGIYFDGSNNIRFATAGVQSAKFDASGNFQMIASGAQIQLNDGTLALPGISFANDLDTGIYRNGSGEYRFVSNGVTQMMISPNDIRWFSSGTDKLNWNGTDFFPVDNAHKCGKSGARWSEIWAANGTIQTSMLATKTDVEYMEPDECKIPKAIYFRRPTDNHELQQLGFEADILPEEAHPVINDETGERSKEDVYTSAVIAMLCQAARNDYERIKSLEARLAKLEAQ